MLNAVIVDDEIRNIVLLSYCIEKYCPQVSLVASFTKKKKAISNLRNSKHDILFLDIILDSGSGFDILDQIENKKHSIIKNKIVEGIIKYVLRQKPEDRLTFA